MFKLKEPETKLDSNYSDKTARPVPWSEAQDILEKAEIFWISTTRPDGRPHVTPLVAVWHEGAMYFCTDRPEQKFRNLESNPHCVLTTGCNTFNEGYDIVFEGEAVNVRDTKLVERLAELWQSKYKWHWDVRDGSFYAEGGHKALVFEVRPQVVFGFGKGAGEPFSQTRWRFSENGR